MTIELHPLFSAHAVLQRGRPIAVYGFAKAGAGVEVELAGRTASTRAESNGSFVATLPALEAGGPHVLSVNAGGETHTVEDVLIGELWLCSGQSNMQWELPNCTGAQAELEAPEDTALRLFYVELIESDTPQDDTKAFWERSTSKALRRASGVASFFARRLRRELGVPVGLVMAAWGGTRLASWIPEAKLDEPDKIRRATSRVGPHISNEVKFYTDPGNTGEGLGFARRDFDDSAWSTMALPCFWQDAGEEYNGAVWFRKAFELPAELSGLELELELGAIDDFEVTYVNGERVGATDANTINAHALQRRYALPPGLLRKGQNVVAVRVFDHYGMGGFAGPASRLRVGAPGVSSVHLSGSWRYFAEHRLLPWHIGFDQPGTAGPYNAMVHPLRRSAFGGVLFYQGESDASRAERYQRLFPLMIESWRETFADPALPFLFVQLANFLPRAPHPEESDWAELREAQRLSLSLPNTAMAVAIDVGDAVDIHPTDKKTVGERLALAALSEVYGRKQPFSGPLFRKAERQGNSMRVEFEHAQGLRSRDGGPVRGFSIAGSNGRFVWADAQIVDQAILVSAASVSEPVGVRYGWASNPDVNLENAAGLPASPFRSDEFPLVTHGVR